MRFGLAANDYFGATADPSPVLHYSSLSVEEQFHIVWPTILVGLYAWLPQIADRGRQVAIGRRWRCPPERPVTGTRAAKTLEIGPDSTA